MNVDAKIAPMVNLIDFHPPPVKTEILLVGLAGLVLLAMSLLLSLRRSNNIEFPTYDEIPDKILHHMPSRKELQDLDDIDVAIIGSGIGSLSCACILSKCGYKVAVFEQHYTVGGSTHMFKDGGYEFDVGVHYVGGELDSNLSVFRWMFDLIS